MKKINIYVPLLIFSLMLGSCKKFLDVKVSSQQGKAETAEDCQLLLDNYAVMNTGYPSDGELSADDYFMQPTYYSSSSVSAEDRDLYIWWANARRAGSDPQWLNPYKVVLRANLVLETIQKLEGGATDQVTLNALKGAALFYRAYALWNVAQLYAKPYTAATAGQDPGIPLVTSTDLNDKFGRGTVQQTYDQIVQDLQDAVNLLPATSIIATRPNKATAYAMLARTWLSMESYPNALTAANSALEMNGLKDKLLNYKDIPAGSFTPFAPRFNREVIFHSVIYPSAALAPHPTKSLIDANLVASYDDNDLRKSLFFRTLGGGNYFFIGNYEGGFLSSNFFNGLAVDELYLVRAECYARANKVSEAMKDLNDLLRTRWKVVLDANGNQTATSTYVDYTAANADDALSKILTERRKELVMRAQRWTDLRRLNKDPKYKKDLIRKTIVNGSEQTIGTLPANDSRYVLLIPDPVINNSGIAQNSR